MSNGGYEDGYRACPCFWGDQPGSLVKSFLQHTNVKGLKVLDIGCGEGKNAAAFASRGATVDAVDCSTLAIANGRRSFSKLKINWSIEDALAYEPEEKFYDCVVLYGLTHCLPDKKSIVELIERMIKATKPGGSHILVAFNDRDQNFEFAHPGFQPTLLPHNEYVSLYRQQEIVNVSDSILQEVHPHNGIPHHHSMTRMTVRIK